MRSLPFLGIGLASVLSLAPPASAQIRNVALVGRYNQQSRYNDIWAFKSPVNGKEYALVGATTGIAIVDISNPRQPVQRGFFQGTRSSTWRDVKNFGNYVYAVTENRSEGMMVIDMTRPDSPTRVGFWGANSTWRNAHNIGMDFGTGIAYICGTRLGTLFVDVKTNPRAPTQIGRLSSPYMHDVTQQNGYGYWSDQNGNEIEIYDIRNRTSATRLGGARLPGARISHNSWPTWDDRYCVTTNETTSGPIGVFDVTNKRAPRLLTSIRAASSFSAIPHNAYIRDYVVYASYYTEGLVVWDISNPSQPVQVGQYDTWPGSSGGFSGAWGAIPPLDNGLVCVTDSSTGLYVVKPKASARYYGKGTVGTGGQLPTIWKRGASFLGNGNFQINVRDAKTSSAGILLIGGKEADVTAGGLNLLVDLVSPPPVIATAATGTNGQATQAFPIPSDNNLNGVKLFAQWFVVDAGANSALGISATKGMEFELFAR